MRINRRGVQMPVMMIVILIIAIVTLGLIIGFINVFFGKTTDLVSGQLKQVEDELSRKCEQSSELLCTNFGRILEIPQGEPKTAVFAIRNSFRNTNGDSVCYLTGVKCVKPFSPDGFCSPTLGRNGLYVGGIDLEDVSGNSFVTEEAWVTKIEQAGRIDVLNNDLQSGSITFQVPAPKDSYTMQLDVWKEKNNNDCNNAVEFSPWQTVRFTAEIQ